MLSVFQINESWFFCPWFFCLKSYSKKYTALTNTCVNKDGFVCVDTRILLWNWYQKKIYFDWKVSQSNVSKGQNSSFHLTSGPLMWRPLHLRWDEDLSCLLNPLMSGIQKCSTYKNWPWLKCLVRVEFSCQQTDRVRLMWEFWNLKICCAIISHVHLWYSVCQNSTQNLCRKVQKS